MLSQNTYTGDGVTKVFQTGFEFISESDVRVVVSGVLKTRGTDYSIQNPTNGAGKGSNIAFNAAPANSAAIKFFRNTPIAVPVKNPTISHLMERVAIYRMQERDESLQRDMPFFISATDLAAHTTQSIVAPCDGYIEYLETSVAEAIGTGGNITVSVDGVAVTGLSVTIANSAAAGKTQNDTPTTPHDASTVVKRGQTIQVLCPSFATSGAVRGVVRIQPSDV
jgi:hypothetical protein